jgi:DhnA family fructose-bisphosphate aldolase class Ia
VIVAMDHGMISGPLAGLERPGDTIAKVLAGGADAVLTTYGLARSFARQLAGVGLILRSDGGNTDIGPKTKTGAIDFTVEAALRLGADALAISAFPGAAREVESLQFLAQGVQAAHAWGMPVLAEMVPGGFDSGPEFRTLESIALAARVGAELGADLVKCPYAEGFGQVASTVYAPVVILGGAKAGGERDMLAKIKAAIDAGGAGVAIGRHIWQAPDPARMTAAVVAIVHDNASVDEAMKLLE